ncbi:hypothetical protein AB0C61_02790 [Streptomyces sp. NPDC048680]|uniref:hypothetical protein n=1 Tax=Streptomyces sp. NPDC048680 TaxID=3155492 RepID=UPI003423694E
MNLTDVHRRLRTDVLDVGGACVLALTGGHVVRAHGLAVRLKPDELGGRGGNP